MTTGRAQIRRIGSNYTRLLLGFLIGLFTVRQLLAYGHEVFNVYTIVTVGAGIGIMLKELMRIAVVPHLSRAIHSGAEDFGRVYATCTALAGVMVVLGVLLMGLLATFFGEFEVRPDMVPYAQVYIAMRAVMLALGVGLSPLFAMLLVTQRFQQTNTLLTAERAADLAGALAPLAFAAAGLAQDGPALVIFGAATLVALMAVYIVAARYVLSLDPRNKPRLGMTDRRVLAGILHTLGWSAVLVISVNLYLRFDAFFINLSFGLGGTIAFGICVQLIGFVRQMTNGLISGVDAVFSKLAHAGSGQSEGLSARDLMYFTTFMQALTTFYMVGFLCLCGAEVLRLWLGPTIDPSLIPLTVALLQAMLVGMGVRSISEGWMTAMNGLGQIHLYAPKMLPFALGNPVLLGAIAWLSAGRFGILWVGIVFSVLHGIAHGIIIPAAYARANDIRLGEMLRPVTRAAPLAAVSIGSLAVTSGTWRGDDLRALLIVGAILAAFACIDLGLMIRQIMKRDSHKELLQRGG